jgi:hypothetical protein
VKLRIGRAGPDDDAPLRRLLRETAMDGEVQVAFAREPSFFFASAVEGDTVSVVARDGDAAVAVFSRSVRPCWVAGEPRRLAYLSALRIAPGFRQSRRLLQEGFRHVRQLEEVDPAALPWSITTIVSDNERARRLLEAGLPGLPRYVPQEDLVTLAATPWRPLGVPPGAVELRRGDEVDPDEIVGALQRWGERHELGPVWDRATLEDRERCRDLSWRDFRVATRGGRVVGCVAAWDQGGYKQTVVAGYGGHLRWSRPVVNGLARWLRVPRLPAPGGELRHLTLSHLAVDDDDPGVLTALVGAAHDDLIGRVGHLTTMLAARHPLLPPLRELLRPREYRSTLYRVAFGEPPPHAGRIPHLEVAVL